MPGASENRSQAAALSLMAVPSKHDAGNRRRRRVGIHAAAPSGITHPVQHPDFVRRLHDQAKAETFVAAENHQIACIFIGQLDTPALETVAYPFAGLPYGK